jgi:hypothetical protein
MYTHKHTNMSPFHFNFVFDISVLCIITWVHFLLPLPLSIHFFWLAIHILENSCLFIGYFHLWFPDKVFVSESYFNEILELQFDALNSLTSFFFLWYTLFSISWKIFFTSFKISIEHSLSPVVFLNLLRSSFCSLFTSFLWVKLLFHWCNNFSLWIIYIYIYKFSFFPIAFVWIVFVVLFYVYSANIWDWNT